ncbi:MAG: zinc ribbon domain-containing protein [Clostridia bacterium]|nr:zinc ribbon domain-containing protein [Clostridia bacterium]
MSVKKCSCCGRDIPTESKFCPYCRKDLSQELNLCPSCGKELPLESKFCPYCMERINEPVSVTVPENKQELNKKIIIIVAIVLLIVLGVAIAVFFSQNNKTASNGIVDNEDTTESTESAESSSGEFVSENDEIIVDFYDEIYITDDEQTSDENEKDIISKTEPNTNNNVTKQDVTKATQKEETTTEADPCAYGHEWIELTNVIHHNEEGHYGMVEKQRPVTMYKCPVCYKKYTSLDEYYSHFDSSHKPSYSGDPVGAFRNQYTTVTGYEYYEVEEWIVDREAYDETVITGYKCSICGKEKNN